MTMRERFYELVPRALEDDPRVAVVLADIGAGVAARAHERIFNVGIREQLMIGVAAGLALEGYRPVAHSYAPFLVERAVRAGQARPRPPGRSAPCSSRPARRTTPSTAGRTHQSPADVALVSRAPRLDDPRSRPPGRARAARSRGARAATTASTSACRRRRNAQPVARRRPRRAAAGERRRRASRSARRSTRCWRRRPTSTSPSRTSPRVRPFDARGLRAPSSGPTSSSSSRTRRAPRRPRSPTRSPTGRTGCSRSASAPGAPPLRHRRRAPRSTRTRRPRDPGRNRGLVRERCCG